MVGGARPVRPSAPVCNSLRLILAEREQQFNIAAAAVSITRHSTHCSAESFDVTCGTVDAAAAAAAAAGLFSLPPSLPLSISLS